jgi:hypothetical protein
MNTLVELINSMETKEDDENFKNAVDYFFEELELGNEEEGIPPQPDHFAVRQYKKYKLAAGVICSKRRFNQSHILDGVTPVAAQRTDGNSNPAHRRGKDYTMDKRTAIYCRAAHADIGAMAAQEATLRAYADEHGHTEIVRYRDNRANGLTLNRPALNELTAAVKAGEIGAVLVVNLSRIARNFMLVSEWRSLADGCGTALVSIGGGENAPTKI